MYWNRVPITAPTYHSLSQQPQVQQVNSHRSAERAVQDTARCQCARPDEVFKQPEPGVWGADEKGGVAGNPLPCAPTRGPRNANRKFILGFSSPSHKTRASGHHTELVSLHTQLHLLALHLWSGALGPCSEEKRPLGGDTGLNSVLLRVTAGILPDKCQPSLPRALESVPTVAGSQKPPLSFPTLPGMLLGESPTTVPLGFKEPSKYRTKS